MRNTLLVVHIVKFFDISVSDILDLSAKKLVIRVRYLSMVRHRFQGLSITYIERVKDILLCELILRI